MLKMLLIVFIIGHWMACLFTFVAREEEYTEGKNWLFAA